MISFKQYLIESTATNFILSINDIKQIQKGEIDSSLLMVNNHIKSADIAEKIIQDCRDIKFISNNIDKDNFKSLLNIVDDNYEVSGKELSKIDPNEESIDSLEDDLMSSFGIENTEVDDTLDNTEDINKYIRKIVDNFKKNVKIDFDLTKYTFKVYKSNKYIIGYTTKSKDIIKQIM